MKAQNLPEIIKKSYQESVEPKIKREDYKSASFDMNDLVLFMRKNRYELIREVPMGSAYLTLAKKLYDELRIGDKEGIEKAERDFEAKLL